MVWRPSSGAGLRPDDGVEGHRSCAPAGARDVSELWHWRARTTQIQKEPERYPPPAGWTYERIIAETAAKAGKEGLFNPVGQDFPALGKPYRDLTEAKWNELTSIARERHHAFNWLCGRHADWDLVPTDT